jgi:hypothetical protein
MTSFFVTSFSADSLNYEHIKDISLSVDEPSVFDKNLPW